MGESEVKSAALWLGKLLAEEITYLGGVTGEVETLQSELNTLAAFLTEAVKTRRQDGLVQTTLTEARNLAYDCQDVIETYMLQVACHGYEEYQGCQVGSILRWACLFRKVAPVHQIRTQIDDLNKKISALKTNLVSFGVTGRINQVGSDPGPLRRVYTHAREESVVVGLEKDLSELVRRLLDPTDQTVIVISGMGGLGKSTLATELYHLPELRKAGGYFQAFGWGIASQRLQPDKLLRTILYSLVPEDDLDGRRKIDEAIGADRGHAALYDLMKQVKCLVIVDDIWASADWDMLEAAFPRRSATGSRLILTTRNQDVLASALDQDQVHLHPMQGLSEINSWDLFQKTAFPAATCTDSTKEKLGRDMVRHCKGVPMAIVVLGKVLRTKERVKDWEQMRNDIFAQIQNGSGSNNPIEKVYNVLQVSYDELPLHLKHCFLHLANFPEDYEIPTAKLYQLWAAEGIIVQAENRNELEEDTAERYLNELVSRSMIQAASWRDDGTNRIEKCRLHDLMRDVCIDIARKEGFVQTINCERSDIMTNQDHLLLNSLPQRDKRLRRLAVYISDHQRSSKLVDATTTASANVSRAPNLRSLLLFKVHEQQGTDQDYNKAAMKTIFEDYPLLRVFDCEEFDMIHGDLCEKVGDLIHLRYLCLAQSGVTGLPSSIGKLQWLQTLDLRVGIVVSLPNVLWKMKQLRHLYLPYQVGLELGYIYNKPQRYEIKGGGKLRLDGLSKLQTMVNINLDTLNVDGLANLERLKTLSVACETSTTALYPFLSCSGMESITLNRLHGQIINEDPMILSSCEVLHSINMIAEPYTRFKLLQPLRTEMLPKSLVSLGVWYLQLDDDPFPVLELLPNLRFLGLVMCYNGYEMVCSANGFPELTSMYLDGLFGFSHWEIEEGALPKLDTLRIVNCPVGRENLPGALPSTVKVRG